MKLKSSILGCALTCYALWRASRSIRSGDHHQTNRMFRARIYAQFFTIVCMVGGSFYYAEEREKRKVFDSVIAQKKVAEKKEAWIKELEARDEEEKELKAKKDAEKKKLVETKVVANSTLERTEVRKLGVVDAVRNLAGFRR